MMSLACNFITGWLLLRVNIHDVSFELVVMNLQFLTSWWWTLCPRVPARALILHVMIMNSAARAAKGSSKSITARHWSFQNFVPAFL